jgi:hypothetical protein
MREALQTLIVGLLKNEHGLDELQYRALQDFIDEVPMNHRDGESVCAMFRQVDATDDIFYIKESNSVREVAQKLDINALNALITGGDDNGEKP